MGILAWVIGGLMSIFGALTFAEVAVLIPRTGGMVAYLGESFNERVGFLAGWMQVVIFYPSFLAGYGVKVGTELAEYVGTSFSLPIALFVIVTLVAINCGGSVAAGRMQVVATVCKLIPLVVLIVFGLILGEGGHPILKPVVGEGVSAGSALGSTLLAVLFAFEGWTNVGAIAGEMRHPARDLPRSIVGGVLIIMAVYLAINIAYLQVIPASELMMLSSPAAAVAERLFGHVGGTIIKLGIIVSVIGAGNGFLLAGSRVAYQLGTERMLPAGEALSKLNAHSSPARSIMLIGALACAYSLSGEFDLLTDLGVFSCWVFYTLTFVCVIRLRHTHPELERAYRVPGYPIIPIIAIAGGLFVIVSQLFLSGSRGLLMSVVSVAITLVGLPVYYAASRGRNSR
jgi:APA family basic amino acid/polyamine antiporter